MKYKKTLWIPTPQYDLLFFKSSFTYVTDQIILIYALLLYIYKFLLK